MPDIKDRIKELRRLPANELIPNPKNWRRHPPSQRAALGGVLEEIGFADAVIAIETPEGLKLVDGHLRQSVMGTTPVPVLVLDLTEEEADHLLLTLDPLAMMVSTDKDKLLSLLVDSSFQSQAVNDMLEGLANGERTPLPDWTQPDWSDIGTPTQEEIDQKAKELGGQFTDLVDAHTDQLLDIVCPKCQEEFSIHRRELTYHWDKFGVDS